MFPPLKLFAMLLALLLPMAPAQANLDNLERNTDRPGGDYDNFGTRNAKSCAQECRDDRRCKAFTFNQDGKHCWLKDRVSAKRHGNRLVSGVKGGHHGGGGGGQNNLPSEIGGVTLERHSDRKGSDYRNLHTKNAEVCARTCSHENRCRAFAYQVDAQRCWLKDGVPSRYDFGPSVSGVKQRHHGGGSGGGGGHQGNLPAEVSGVTLERHSDRKGSDYRHLQTGKAEDCAYVCSEERRCKAFAWQTQSQTCWLKSRVPNRYSFRDSVSGVKRGAHHGGGGGGGGNSGDVAGVTIERNSDRMGSDYRNLSTANAKDCAFLCSEERRCVAFAYQVREKHCWLKDSVPNRYHLKHSVSGVKTGGNRSRDYDDDDYDRRRRNAEEIGNTYGAD